MDNCVAHAAECLEVLDACGACIRLILQMNP